MLKWPWSWSINSVRGFLYPNLTHTSNPTRTLRKNSSRASHLSLPHLDNRKPIHKDLARMLPLTQVMLLLKGPNAPSPAPHKHQEAGKAVDEATHAGRNPPAGTPTPAEPHPLSPNLKHEMRDYPVSEKTDELPPIVKPSLRDSPLRFPPPPFPDTRGPQLRVHGVRLLKFRTR